jgi:hypothetical protein
VRLGEGLCCGPRHELVFFLQVPPLQRVLYSLPLACVQVPLLAGVVSLLIDDALQDRFATFTRELVDRGNRVLATER